MHSQLFLEFKLSMKRRDEAKILANFMSTHESSSPLASLHVATFSDAPPAPNAYTENANPTLHISPDPNLGSVLHIYWTDW